jgi:NAD+ diphosphatase
MQKNIDSRAKIARLAFVSSDLDRHSEWRGQVETVQKLADDPDARFVGILGDAVAGKGDKPDYGRPQHMGESIFLGLDADGHPWFAYAANESETLALRPLLLSGSLPQTELSRLAQARSLVHWHQSHAFCARCGTPSVMQDAGYRRHCVPCGGDHFPRTDPVVIMSVEHGDAVLLGRQASWPAGMYSALAGFMEPGETIEQAVAREVFEEAGVRVRDVEYVASQPWPFPASLMIGMRATALSRDLTVDGNELEDARWFVKSDVQKMLQRSHPDGFYAANPFAIAHVLISAVVDEPSQE